MSLIECKQNLLAGVEDIDKESFSRTLEELRGESQSYSKELAGLGRGIIDVSGTGGSGLSKFNTSTATAFVLAALGIPVVKFGNRSATGNSGSKDFLDQLGVSTCRSETSIAQLLDKENLVFLNARDFYPDLIRLAQERKRLGRPTILNYLGPLLNPVSPEYRLMGVSSKKILPIIAEKLLEEPSLTKAVLVTSGQSLDELDPDNLNTYVEVADNEIKTRSLAVFDLPSMKSLAQVDQNGGSNKPGARENAEIFQLIVDGKDKTSRIYRSLVLNAGAGILLAGRADDLTSAIEIARELIKDGAVKAKLLSLRSTQESLAA